jgi:hypothetical protein
MVYTLGAAIRKRSITAGLEHPFALALDASGDLYVKNNGSRRNGGYVNIYAPGSSSLLSADLARGTSAVWAVDPSGWLYVTLFSEYEECRAPLPCVWYERVVIDAYAPHGSTLTQTISYSEPCGTQRICPNNDLVVDPHGSVYTYERSGGGFSIWTQGLTSRLGLPFNESVSDGIAWTAFDVSGARYEDDGLAVNEYSPLSSSLLRTITPGVAKSSTLVVDSLNNLYVANETGPSVTVYAPGQTSVLRTITNGITAPIRLRIDRFNNLYVLNGPSTSHPTGAVTVYAPGASTSFITITYHIYNPEDMVVF